jgi:hypothetical protein
LPIIHWTLCCCWVQHCFWAQHWLPPDEQVHLSHLHWLQPSLLGLGIKYSKLRRNVSNLGIFYGCDTWFILNYFFCGLLLQHSPPLAQHLFCWQHSKKEKLLKKIKYYFFLIYRIGKPYLMLLNICVQINWMWKWKYLKKKEK